MPQRPSESRFHMWRTLFAMSHVDNVVSDEEVRFMAEALVDVPFSDEQRQLLQKDTVEPQDVVEMFKGITDPKDQAEFFHFARDMVWADGSYGREEQDILLKLQKLHIKTVNVDELVNKVNLEFAEESSYTEGAQVVPRKKKGIKSMLSAFVAQFEDEFKS